MKDGLMERGEGVNWKVDVMKDGLMEWLILDVVEVSEERVRREVMIGHEKENECAFKVLFQAVNIKQEMGWRWKKSQSQRQVGEKGWWKCAELSKVTWFVEVEHIGMKGCKVPGGVGIAVFSGLAIVMMWSD